MRSIALPLACLAAISFAPSMTAEGQTIAVTEATDAALRHGIEKVAARRAGGHTGPLTLTLVGGEYRLAKPLVLDAHVVGEGLTIESAAGAEAVINGARLLEAPTKQSEGRWKYPLPADWQLHGTPRAVVIDGELHAAAREPDAGYFRVQQALPDRRSGFTFDAGEVPKQLEAGRGVLDLVFLHDWSSSRLPVQSVDYSANVLTTVGPIGASGAHYAIDHFEPHPRYYLEGDPSFADEPGEWYVDVAAAQVVVVPQPDATEPPIVELPVLDELLVAEGTATRSIENLTLRRLAFTGTRFPMPSGGLAAVQAANYEGRNADGSRQTSARGMLSAAVRIEQAHGCVVASCRFSALGNSGLWLASRTRNCTAEDCTFADIGGNGLNLGEDNSRRIGGKVWYESAPDEVPTGNRIVDCRISRVGRLLPGAVAVWGGLQKQVEIAGNHIQDCPYTGISLGWIWNPSASPAGENRIRGNHIERVMQTLNDGGGIYTLGRQPGSEIADNTIEDVPLNVGSAESNGLFLDEGTAGWTVKGNTFRRIARSPIRFHRAEQNTVVNNSWELAPETPPVRFNSTPESNITIRDNTVLDAQ